MFIWTAFDYRGETFPWNWPAVISSYGAMDFCGFEKDVFYYWKSIWTQEPMVHGLPDVYKRQYDNIARDYDALYGEGSFLEDNRIAKLYPAKDGNKYYFIDTEAWSESYISSGVDDVKMDAICRLYDYLYSEEGSRLVFCGFEGEDYELDNGQVVMKEGVNLSDKYTFCNVNCNISALAMWNPETWDMSFTSTIPEEYRKLNEERHEDAVKNGTLPKYYDSVLFISTPLKDSFVYNTNDDLLQIMMGTDPVDKMVDDLLANYERDVYKRQAFR